MEQSSEVLILYADVLVFLNFALDFLCLVITSRVAARKFVGWRCVLGALFGAVYALSAVMLSLPVWIHFPAAAILCLIAFSFDDGKRFAKVFFVFLMTNAGMGGLISAFYYIGTKRATAAGIIGIAVLFSVLCILYGLYCRKKVSTTTMKIEVKFGENVLAADVLVDSGNLVTEPFSALPVVILSSSVLPPPLDKPDIENSPVPLRAIPIRTETGLGLLYGFIPDSITLCPPFEKRRRIDAVVGIDTDNNSFAGHDGLLPGCLV